MRSRSTRICLQIMERLIQRGFTNEVLISDLKEAIVYVRGPDPRTIKNWMGALETLGFITRIQRVHRKGLVWKVVLAACPELDEEVEEVRIAKSQRRLM